MRSKTILSWLVFVAAFAVSVAVTPTAETVSYFAPSQERVIGELLRKDVSNGFNRDNKVRFAIADGDKYGSAAYYLHYTAAMAAYTEKAAALDTDRLPGEFRDAWLQHVEVWQSYTEFLEQNIDSDGKLMRERGFYRQDKQYNSEITETWMKTLRIAVKYGAEIPAGALPE